MQLHHIFSNAPSGIRYYVTCNLVYFVHESRRSACSFICAISRAREKREVAVHREGFSRGRGANLAAALLGFSKNDELSKKRDRFVTRIIALLLSLPLGHELFSLALLSAFSLAPSRAHIERSVAAAAHRLLLISTSCINVSITRLSTAAAAAAAASAVESAPLLFLPSGPFAYSRASSRLFGRTGWSARMPS